MSNKQLGIRELIALLQSYVPADDAQDVPVAVVVEGRAVDLIRYQPEVILYPQGLRICLASDES